MKSSILFIVFAIFEVHFSYEIAPQSPFCENVENLQATGTYVDHREIHLFVAEKTKSPVEYWAAVVDKEFKKKGVDSNVTEANNKQAGQFRELGNIPEAGFYFYSNCIKDYGFLFTEKGPVQFVRGKDLMWPTEETKVPFKLKDGSRNLEFSQVKVVSISLVKQDDERKYAIYKVIFLEGNGQKVNLVKVKVDSEWDTISLTKEEPQGPIGFGIAMYTEEVGLFNWTTDGITIGYQFRGAMSYPIFYTYEEQEFKEYPMVKEDGTFNIELLSLKLKENRYKYVIPLSSWLNCPGETHCLGRPPDAVASLAEKYHIFWKDTMYTVFDPTKPFWKLKTEGSDYVALDKLSSVLGVQRIDVAFGIDSTRLHTQTVILKDSTLWIYDVYYKRVVKVDTFDSAELGLPSGITNLIEAAFTLTTRDVVYIFADSKIYQVPLRKFEALAVKYPPVKFTPPDQNMNVGRSIGNIEGNMTVDIKRYEDVNAAFTTQVDLAFYYKENIVTMVNHFITEQFYYKFYKERVQTEFKLLGQFGTSFFGCEKAKFNDLWNQKFLDQYIKFARPSSGGTPLPSIGGRTTKEPITTSEGEADSTSHTGEDRKDTISSDDGTPTKETEKPYVNEDSGIQYKSKESSASMTNVLKSLILVDLLFTLLN